MRRTLKPIFLLTISICCIPFLTATSYDDSIKVYNNKGVDLYVLGDLKGSEQNFRTSLRFAEEKYGDSHTEVADAYNNLGVVLMKAWQYDSALTYLSRACTIYIENNETISIATVYSNIGNINRFTGDYGLAIHYYNKALLELTPLSSENAYTRQLEVLNRMGLLQLEQKNYQQAALYFGQAKKIIEKKTYQFMDYLIRTIYVNLSTTQSYLGNNDSCLYFFNQAKIYLNKEADSYYYLMARMQVELTDHYLRQKNFHEALKSIRLTEKHLDTGTDLETNRIILHQYGNYYSELKDYKNAIDYFTRAEEIITSGISENGTIEYASKTDAIDLLKSRSKAYLGLYQQTKNSIFLIKALNDINIATQLIDESRTNYLSIESKLFISEHAGSIYELGVYCATQLHRVTNKKEYIEQAFFYSEKGKSAILLDALIEENAKNYANIPQELVTSERNLKREISFFNEELYTENLKILPDSNTILRLKNKLFELNTNYENLKNYLKTSYPEYYRFKYNNKTADLESIKKHLPDNTSLIEFVLTDSIIYTFVVNNDHTIINQSKFPPTNRKVLEDFLQLFSNFNFHKQEKDIYSTFEKEAYNIFQFLFKGIDINELGEELIIIPDKTLSYLPFESLVTTLSNTKPRSFNDINFLLHDFYISYSYSATLHIQTKQKTKRKILNKALAVAPAYSYEYNGTNKSDHSLKYRMRDRLNPLPYAKEEVNTIRELTKGKALLDTNATLERFLKYVNSYDILHLSMHTIIDDQEPMYSKLIFYDENYINNEGLLNTSQLYSLKLDARFSVLSACSSGGGGFKEGEGVISLSRGFFYAGCPSLIMTLWKVEDKSSLQLMKLFYKNLIKGYSKSEALQLAKIKYLQTSVEYSKHPFFWTSYILIGDTSPIYYSRKFLFSGGAVIIAILLLLIFKVLNRKKPLPEPK